MNTFKPISTLSSVTLLSAAGTTFFGTAVALAALGACSVSSNVPEDTTHPQTFSCSAVACPRDTVESSCPQKLSDPHCGVDYLALGSCVLGHPSCLADGTSNGASSLSACSTEVNAYVACTLLHPQPSGADASVMPTLDAGNGQVPDAAPPATDVAGSYECKDYCNTVEAACPTAICSAKLQCGITPPHCAASTKAFLECEALYAQVYCGADGFSAVSSCSYDDTVCP